jgi:hypothetical protein
MCCASTGPCYHRRSPTTSTDQCDITYQVSNTTTCWLEKTSNIRGGGSSDGLNADELPYGYVGACEWLSRRY